MGCRLWFGFVRCAMGGASAFWGSSSGAAPTAKRSRGVDPAGAHHADADLIAAIRNDPGMQMMARQTLRTAAEMRTVKAIVSDTFIGDGTKPVFANPKQGGTDYHAAIAKTGKGHNLRSPHKYQVEKLLHAIWEDPGIDPNDKKQLETFAAKYSGADELGKVIPTLRMSLTYEKKARVMIAYSHEAKAMGIELIVRRAYQRAGAERKANEAPRNHMERQIRELSGIGREFEASKGSGDDRCALMKYCPEQTRRQQRMRSP